MSSIYRSEIECRFLGCRFFLEGFFINFVSDFVFFLSLIFLFPDGFPVRVFVIEITMYHKIGSNSRLRYLYSRTTKINAFSF